MRSIPPRRNESYDYSMLDVWRKRSGIVDTSAERRSDVYLSVAD
jgi:hypothetical protein